MLLTSELSLEYERSITFPFFEHDPMIRSKIRFAFNAVMMRYSAFLPSNQALILRGREGGAAHANNPESLFLK